MITLGINSKYLFELSQDTLDSLTPFKVDDLAVQQADSASESGSEVDSNGASSSEENETIDKEVIEDGKRAKKVEGSVSPKEDYSSTYRTQYNEVDESESLRWELENVLHIKGSPYVTYQSTLLDQSRVLRVYKNWLDKDKIIAEPVQDLKKLVLGKKSGKSCVVLLGGGHFSAMIVNHRRGNHKANISNPFVNIDVVASKSFHRYTVRRKQGGSQSASDNAHGKANSAGSTIRRANERALEAEIHELLASWSSHLKQCHRIFYRAPGRSNKGIICGYKDSPIAADDTRLKSIQFATGRATFDECRRAWLQLTNVQVVEKPEVNTLPTPGSKVKSKSPSPSSAPAQTLSNKKPVLSENEKRTQKIIDLVKRSKLPQLKSLLSDDTQGYDFRLEPLPKYASCPTALLYAAVNNKHNVVSGLLEWGADPTIRNAQGLTIGDLASSHFRVIDALRVSRSNLGEAKWNWDAAKVGTPVTREELAARDAADRLQKRLEQEKISREQEEREHSEKIEKLISRHGTGRTTGGNYTASRGLTEEDLRHVERERRARAAEARMARLKNGQ